VGQTYYADPESAQFDPDYSSNSFETGGTQHYSPLQSRLRLLPTPRSRVMTVAGSVSGERGNLLASWSRSEAFRRNNRVVPARSSVRSAGRLELLPERLALDLQADWDFVTGKMVHSAGRLRYDVQCCGFMVELIRYDYNQRAEQQFRFSIELANIGAFGNFNGEERGRPQTMGLGNFK
jgi:hypothetical protein